MVLSEGPITPPDSPGPQEMATDQPPIAYQQQQPTQIIVEDRQFVNIEYPATPVSQPPETPIAMEEDMTPSGQELGSVRALSRALSEENVEHDTGSIKLTDFEVRGTLGVLYSSTTCAPLLM